MDGKWSWPISQLAYERKLVPAENAIDIPALRSALKDMDDRAGERLIAMLADSEFMSETTVPLESGLPQPKEIGTRLLRRIRRLHNMLLNDIGNDPDGDLVKSRRLVVPHANIRSPLGEIANRDKSE